MPRTTTTSRGQARGCAGLVVGFLLIAGGCNAIFGSDDTVAPPVAHTPAPIPSYTPWTPEASTPKPAADLDDDGATDVHDNDDDDGANLLRDIDDHDPGKGGRPKPKKAREPRPRPEPEPVQVGNVRPGGFCGTPGAVGTSRGRTYVCRGGHWRR
ncbi:hypothetical protein [Nonomuraea sp. NPDC049695]|uniref:hypothetical protein n=1 Tax=Nonomuraea sp. NPDC049695 TaxID=3154734 RepID=UPI00341F526B